MNRWIEFALVLISGIIGTLLAEKGTGHSYYLVSPIVIIIVCEIMMEHGKKMSKKYRKDEEDDIIISLIDNLNTNKSDKYCQVCGKEIEPNENGTCKECHEEIMRRLKSKSNK